jgi:hypothetical protein
VLITKSAVFWNMLLCNFVVHLHVGGTYPLRLQGIRVSK